MTAANEISMDAAQATVFSERHFLMEITLQKKKSQEAFVRGQQCFALILYIAASQWAAPCD